MFNNVVLDIFIGLVFIFLLYSLLATILMELYARAFNLRARMLQKALRRMLEDDDSGKDGTKPIWQRFTILAYFYTVISSLFRFFNPNWRNEHLIKIFYKHPSIKYLGEDHTSSKPSYLHCHNFSQTMIQMLRGTTYDGRTQNESELIKNALDNNLLQIKNETLQHLKDMFADARQDSLIFKLKLEDWFDETMQRANGWYKKQTQVVLILIGFYVAFLFNVDTVAIYKILATDKEARKNLVQMAIDNKEKYQAVMLTIDTSVANKIKNTKDTLVIQHMSDSLLKETYKSISADAEKVNSILALGKPWKDSCKICDDSISIKKDQKFTERCRFIKAEMDKAWFRYSPNQQGGWTTFFGWLLTALAISLGAPFWFDLLNKFIQMRTAGARPKGDQTPASSANVNVTKTPGGTTIRG